MTPPNKLTAPTAELPTQKKKAPDGAPRSESPAFRSTHRNAGERFLSQVTNKSLSVNSQTSHRLSYIIIHLVLRKDKPPLGKTRISAILLSFHRNLRGGNCGFPQKSLFPAARRKGISQTNDAVQGTRFPDQTVHKQPAIHFGLPTAGTAHNRISPHFQSSDTQKNSRQLIANCRPQVWSGLRGSNSLPPPWQGGALPDELKPQMPFQRVIKYSTRQRQCQGSFPIFYRRPSEPVCSRPGPFRISITSSLPPTEMYPARTQASRYSSASFR